MDLNSENDTFSNNKVIFFSPNSYGSSSLIATIAVSLIVSASCLFFIVFKLKSLNKYIRICLLIIACQHVVNTSIFLFANITIKITKRRSMLSCLLVTQPTVASNRSTWTMIATVSMLRYWMARKASKEGFTFHTLESYISLTAMQ